MRAFQLHLRNMRRCRKSAWTVNHPHVAIEWYRLTYDNRQDAAQSGILPLARDRYQCVLDKRQSETYSRRDTQMLECHTLWSPQRQALLFAQ